MKKYLFSIFLCFILFFGCTNLTNNSSDNNATGETTGTGSPEIDVQQNGGIPRLGHGDPRVSGVAGIGFSKSLDFTIKNTGTAALTLSGTPLVALSGTDAASFSVKTQPASATIAAGAEPEPSP